MDSARGLIAEKGVDGLRLREIADRADVGFGSFYNHFESKEDIVETVVSDTVATFADNLVERAFSVEDPAEVASISQRGFIRLAYDEPSFARLIVHLDRADVLFEQVVYPYARMALRRGVESGRFAIDDLDVTVAYLAGATITVMRAVLDERLGADADVCAACTSLRALGVAAAEAAAISSRPLPALSLAL